MNQSNLMVLRIIWAALLMGQTVFLVLILAGVVPHQHQTQPIFDYFAPIMLATIVPVMFVIRAIQIRRPSGVVIGNLIFWAGCEGCSFASMIFSVLTTWSTPLICVVAVAMTLQVLTFPRLSNDL